MTMENHQFLMGKSTIFIAIFNSFLYVFQRGITRTAPQPTPWPFAAEKGGIMLGRIRDGGFHGHEGTQKWMVFVREKPTKIDDFGVPP